MYKVVGKNCELAQLINFGVSTLSYAITTLAELPGGISHFNKHSLEARTADWCIK